MVRGGVTFIFPEKICQAKRSQNHKKMPRLRRYGSRMYFQSSHQAMKFLADDKF
jgi:hypothetical protein